MRRQLDVERLLRLLLGPWLFTAAPEEPFILNGVRQQLRPLFDQVVIKELEPDRVRRSGLLLPPGDHQSPPQHGIVLAVGPGLDWWGSVGVKMPVRAGDHVVFPASAGVWVEVEEERLLVCRVGQLLGVLEESPGDRPGNALPAFEDDEA